jgi:Spy/CpxP family protein refolding chaperone
MRLFTATILLVLTFSAHAQSPYAGQENREIKSLSAEEIQGYLDGAGMGFAKAAELNGYPGPKHVLELAEEIELTDEQRVLTQVIFDEMKASTSSLGAQLVEEERGLNQLFASGTVDSQSLKETVARIGRLRSTIRGIHLEAHLRQAKVLTQDQIAHYMHLRGYSGNHHPDHHHRDAHPSRNH